MRKTAFFSILCLYFMPLPGRHLQDLISGSHAEFNATTKTMNVKNTHQQVKEIAAQKCREAHQDVLDEAQGMVLPREHLKKQKMILDQCREAGLLL